MSSTFRREYRDRLPLPLAQLYSRAHNSPDSRSRHNNAFYLCEASIKVAAAALTACYLQEVGDGSARVASLDRLLVQLALPSLGQWVGILRELARHFGERADRAVHPLGHLWSQLNTPRRDLPAVLALFRRIKNGPDGQTAGDQSCALLDLFGALVQYRNGVFGHGADRVESFYAQDMEPLLFGALNEMFAETVFDLLGPPGSRLVYLTELRTADEDRVEVGLRELVGLQGERMAPLVLSAAQADGLLPNRVALWWPGRAAPLRLDPLLQFRESETAEEVLFLNRDRNGRQVEYLSYTTGRTERDKAMAPALAALLSRVAGRTVTEEQLQELAEQSLSETPSFELLRPSGQPAAVVLGDHEILSEVGRGGMGVVYLARQLSLGRLVALKTLPADLAGDATALARFRREIRALARCDHPNIVKVLSSGTLPDGQLYYAMEYVPGCDLEHVWRELSVAQGATTAGRLDSSAWRRAVLSASRKQRDETINQGERTTARLASGEEGAKRRSPAELPLPPLPELPDLPSDPGGYVRRVAQLMRDAALALQTVHEQGLVHRDVKPANLMLTPDGQRIVLMDFGLAKSDAPTANISGSAGFLGTLRYAAPEQLAAATLKVGPRADVRAVGAMLWEFLTRRRLFGDAADEAQLAACIHDEDVPLLRRVDPSLDRDLEAIVARATERSATARLSSAGLLAQYLQMFLDGQPLPIRAPSTAEMLRRWANRHRPLLGAVAAAVLAIVAATAIAFVMVSHEKDKAIKLADEKGQLAEKNGQLALEKGQLAEKNGELADEKGHLAEKNGQLAKDEKAARQAVERSGYLNAIALADREFQAANVTRARELLTGCPERLRGWEWNLLDRACYQGARVLGRLGCHINSVAFSPDGKLLASADQDGTVRLWDIASNKARVLKGHTGAVNRVVFRPDGKQLASAGADKTVRIWDTATGETIYVFDKHTGEVVDLSYHPSGNTLASAGTEGKVLVWQPSKSDNKPGELTTGEAARAVAFSPDRRWLAAANGSVIAVWDLDGGKIRFKLNASAESGGLAFTREGNTLISTGQRTTVKVWDLSGKGLPVYGLHGHTSAVVGVAFPEVGDQFVTAGWDRTVRVWSTAGGPDQLPITLRGHTAQPRCVAFRPDGEMVASADDGGAILLWNLHGRGRADLGELIGDVEIDGNNVAFSSDGKRVAAAGWHLRKIAEDRAESEGEVRIWKLTGADWDKPVLLHGHKGMALDVAFQPGGRLVATAGEDGEIRLWDDVEEHTETRLRGHKEAVNGVAFRPDGQALVSGGKDGTVQIWNVADGKSIAVWKGHDGAVYRVTYSPDGKTVASAGADGTVRLWPTEGGTPLILRGHEGAVRCVAFDRAGHYLASGGDDGTVRLWDAKTGMAQGELRGHSGPVLAVCFDRDGGRLASGGGDSVVPGEVIVWDVEHRVEALKLVGHQGPVSGVAFSPDGLDLVSVGRASLGPGEVYLWSGRPRH